MSTLNRGIRLVITAGAVAVLTLTAATMTLGQQARTEPIAYTPPTIEVVAAPNVVTACPGDTTLPGSRVQLEAKVNVAKGQPTHYKWTVDGGQLIGDGPSPTWDLSGVPGGTYKAMVEVDTVSGEEGCVVFASATVATRCPPPVCPNVLISCPARVAVDQPINFSANVIGGTPSVKGVYNWTVSAGKIISGQGTDRIQVDTTGLAGETITATLSMGGYNLDCTASCPVQIPLPQVLSRKFDEFPAISRNDEKARLDNLAIELQNDPSSTAYVIVYPGQEDRPSDVQHHSERIVEYLVNSRGIDGHRVVTMVGRSHPDLQIQLWITPQGAAAPTP
jgi:PKD-like domain